MDKTNVIHFRKERKKQSLVDILWGDTVIEYVDTYKYLGVELDKNLNFKTHIANMTMAGSRALGKILSKFRAYKDITYNAFTKLYENLVDPIITYNISVLGTKAASTMDNVQNRAIRFYLGVHPKTPIPALIGDMGWLPLKHKRWLHCIRFWNKMLDLDSDRINRKAFDMDYQNSGYNNNWCAGMRNICENLNFVNEFENFKKIDIRLAKYRLEGLVNVEWTNSVNSKPKLRTYKNFKDSIKAERYVIGNLPHHKRSISAQFRAGVLPLEVETGRYRAVPYDQRICVICV